MYTFDEKFKKGADRAFRAQQGLTAFLSGLNRILPEPPGFKTEKTKDEREDIIRIADTAGDSWYLGFSERSITPPDIDAKIIISAATCPFLRAGFAACSTI